MTKVTIYNLDNKLKPPVTITIPTGFPGKAIHEFIAIMRIGFAIERIYTSNGVYLHIDKSNQLAYDVAYVTEEGKPVLGISVVDEPTEFDISLNPT